jgi:hypothetical protein
MNTRQLLKPVAAGTALLAIVVAGTLVRAPRVQAGAGENEDSDEAKIRIGFAIAPVPLNMAGKNHALVGLGSYIVNSAGCDDCHDAGPQTQYAAGGNPFFGQHPTKVNPVGYLGGGRDFGPLIPGSADIVSRNLTPDKSGLPEGGHTLDEFRQILRTGVDLDHLHPTCTGAPNANCVPPPFDGDLLQIMPWPAYQKLTDRDIRAIYEYLKAVPCVSGPPAPSVLHNDC